MKIGILGAGAYGLALGSVFNDNGHEVTIWTKIKEEKKLLEKTRQTNKIKDYFIPSEIKFTYIFKNIVSNSDLIVIAIPAKFVDDIAKKIKPFLNDSIHVCIASKGIEQDTCLFVADVFNKYNNFNNLAVISGPSFAIDIINKAPVGLSLATKSNKTAKVIKRGLENKYFKLRCTKDIIGVEICGSIKNILAIAAGILDGMGVLESTKALFLTESLNDIKDLINGLGGNKKTILSFAGFGDILLTCTSPKSRNFRFGKMISSNCTKDEINSYLKYETVEGVYTLKSISELIKNKNINIPIIDLIYDIVFNNKDYSILIDFLIKK